MQLTFPTPAAALVVLIMGAGLAPRSPGHMHVAADTWLWPAAIGASSASDVYVGLWADAGGRVVRLSGTGEWLGDWPTDGPMKDLAVGLDRSVYTVMDRSGRVYRFAADGTPDAWWQAAYFPARIATGPLGATADGAVYVLWTPQTIGQPAHGPPRVTRYSPRGERLAEWEAAPMAYDLAVVVTDAAPEGVVHVADGGGLLGRFAPDGTFLGEWRTVAGAERRIAAAPAGLLYVAAPGELWRYSETGEGSLACRLPAGEPRDLAADPQTGDIYVLYPDSVLRLAPDCAVRARIGREQLSGQAAPPTTAPGARRLYLPAALAAAAGHHGPAVRARPQPRGAEPCPCPT